MNEDGHPGHLRCLGETEQLLELHRKYGLLGAVLHPDPRPARHLDALRCQLVQPGRLAGRPRQEPPQRLPGVDPRQVGAAAGPGQLGLQPLLGTGQQRTVGHIRPRGAQLPVQKGEPLTQLSGLPGPAQQAEPVAPEPVHQRRPYQLGPRLLQRAHRQFDGAQPFDRARHHVAVHPADLLTGEPQMPGRQPRRVLVDDGGEPHPGGRRVRRPVRDRDGQPRRTAQP